MKTKLVAVFDAHSQSPQPRVIIEGKSGEFYMWDVLHGCMTSRSTIISEYGEVHHARDLTKEQLAENSVQMLRLYSDHPVKIWESGMEMIGLIDRSGLFYLCGGSDHAATMEQLLWMELKRAPDYEKDIIPAFSRFIHVAVSGLYCADYEGNRLDLSNGQEQTLLLLLKTFRDSKKTFKQIRFLEYLEKDMAKFGMPLP